MACLAGVSCGEIPAAAPFADGAEPFLANVPLPVAANAMAMQARQQDATVVPDDWALIPSGLDPGDRFRLIFVSKDARWAHLSDINHFKHPPTQGEKR